MQVTVQDILNATNGRLLNGSADTVINGFFTNSREIDSLPFKNALFVPIIGERLDAHNFIPQVVEAGAKAFFIKKGSLFIFFSVLRVTVQCFCFFHAAW